MKSISALFRWLDGGSRGRSELAFWRFSESYDTGQRAADLVVGGGDFLIARASQEMQ